MNRNKKTKNVKVNKAIDNMGDSATIDALNASLTKENNFKLTIVSSYNIIKGN